MVHLGVVSSFFPRLSFLLTKRRAESKLQDTIWWSMYSSSLADEGKKTPTVTAVARATSGSGCRTDRVRTNIVSASARASGLLYFSREFKGPNYAANVSGHIEDVRYNDRNKRE